MAHVVIGSHGDVVRRRISGLLLPLCAGVRIRLRSVFRRRVKLLYAPIATEFPTAMGSEGGWVLPLDATMCWGVGNCIRMGAYLSKRWEVYLRRAVLSCTPCSYVGCPIN